MKALGMYDSLVANKSFMVDAEPETLAEKAEEVKDPGDDADKEEKHPEDNVNKEGEVAVDNNEEDGCTDEMTDVVRPMDREVKIRLQRKGIHQVAIRNSIRGSTGSHVGSDQHPGHERPVNEARHPGHVAHKSVEGPMPLRPALDAYLIDYVTRAAD